MGKKTCPPAAPGAGNGPLFSFLPLFRGYLAFCPPIRYAIDMEEFYSLTDRQFALIEPILRDEQDARGRKPKISDRQALEGALYVLRRGCGWRAMPAAFGHWMMVFMRYKRWVERGVWWKALMRLQKAGVVRLSIVFRDADNDRRNAAGGRPAKGPVANKAVHL